MRKTTYANLTCDSCGAAFQKPAYNVKSGRQFCSRECKYEALKRRADRVCETCGTAFVARRSAVKRTGAKYCSRQCYSDATVRSMVERFMEKWTYDNGCWRWLGARQRAGHGVLRRHRTRANVLAHRYAYEVFHEEAVPKGKELHHVCGNPWCVFPLHLMPLTKKQHAEAHKNMRLGG